MSSPSSAPTNLLGVTICASKTNTLFVTYDDQDFSGSPSGSPGSSSYPSFIRELTPASGETIRQFPCEALIGEHGGCHSLMDLGCNLMLTVDRDTHEMIEICLPAATDPEPVARVSKRYSLIIDPFDAALADNDVNVVYMDGNSIRVWSRTTDALVKTVKTLDSPPHWPVFLSDGTLLVYMGTFHGDGDVLRLTNKGKLVQTYEYDHAVFGNGLYGMAADMVTDLCSCGDPADGRLWLAGEETPELPAILTLSIKTGDELDFTEIVPLADDCDIAAGFCTLRYTAGTGFSATRTPRPRPSTSCGPVSNLTTVQPNPGCNSGGVGWIPEYTGPSGVVPTVIDPIPGETLTGKTSVFVEAIIDHTEYTAGGGEVSETLRYAMVELDDEQRKEGRIRSIGAIEKSLSGADGLPQAATIDLHIMDAEGRPIGSRMESATKRYFARDEIKVQARSMHGRRANVTPRMIGRGLLDGESYGTSIEAQLTATDPLFADGGPFSPDKKVPQWVYPTSFYSEGPPDIAQLYMPVIFGEVSDHGAINPETGLPNARGKMPARFMGLDGLGTGPGSSREVWGRFNACLFAIYKITRVYGSDLGAMGIYGRSAVSDGESPSTVTLDGVASLASVPEEGWAQLVLFTATGVTKTPIISVNAGTREIVLDGQIEAEIANGISWYISMLDYVPRRVEIDLNVRNGVDFMVPKWPGYIRPTDYEDFTGPQGDYRVTDFWARGPVLDAHLADEVTISFNAVGTEAQGASGGLPLTDFFTAENFFIDNMVHRQVQRPFISDGGLLKWPLTDGDLPQFADGVHKTRQSTFAACQEISARSVGGDGLKISAYFSEGTPIRDVLQWFNDNSGSRLYVNEYGQIAVWLFDPTSDPRTWARIEHVSRVFGDIRRWRAHDETQNAVLGGCDWDPEGQKYREEIDPIVSLTAVQHNKGIKRYSKHIDGRLVALKDQFLNILHRKLALQGDGPVYVQIEHCDLGVLDIPIGSGVLLTSVMGPGAQGWTDHPLIILGNHYDIDEGLVTLTCLEVGNDLDLFGITGSPSGSSPGSGLIIGQPFIVTNDLSIAPVVSNDPDIAPDVAA